MWSTTRDEKIDRRRRETGIYGDTEMQGNEGKKLVIRQLDAVPVPMAYRQRQIIYVHMKFLSKVTQSHVNNVHMEDNAYKNTQMFSS